MASDGVTETAGVFVTKNRRLVHQTRYVRHNIQSRLKLVRKSKADQTLKEIYISIILSNISKGTASFQQKLMKGLQPNCITTLTPFRSIG